MANLINKAIVDFLNELSNISDDAQKTQLNLMIEYVNNASQLDLFQMLKTDLYKHKLYLKTISEKNKIKTRDFDTLNSIMLQFGDHTLGFNLYQEENKRTRLSIVKHLSNLLYIDSLLNESKKDEDTPSNVLQSLFSPEMFKMTNDILKTCEEKRMTNVQDIFKHVTSTLDSKIKSGELDIDKMKKESENLFSGKFFM